MKKTAVIYERQSTNRKGRQENTIEAQHKANTQTIKDYDLILLDTIVEKESAKESNNRNGFKQLMKYCESGKVDYIIIDEADRLSRDDLDSAVFMTILRKGKIKGIIVGGKIIDNNDIYGQFMLWLQFGASKLDNQQRAKKVLEKMLTVKEKGNVLGKVPFGYKNITKEDGKKDVKIIKEEVELGNKILDLIISGESLASIGRKLYPLGLKTNKSGKPWGTERIKRFVNHSFYRGFQNFKGSSPHNYPLVFDLKKLQLAEQKIGNRQYNPVVWEFLLKTKLKAENGENFTAYVKKGNIYYRNQKQKINISEKLIIESFGQVIEQFEIKPKFENYIKEGLKKFYKEQFKNNELTEKNIKKSLKEIREKKSRLLDLFYSGGISADGVKEEQKKFDNQISDLEYELKNLICTDDLILEEAINFIELFKNLSIVWKSVGYRGKLLIFNLIVIELTIDTQKRLKIKPFEVFDLIKSLNSSMVFSTGIEPVSIP